jgi:polyferredoxin
LRMQNDSQFLRSTVQYSFILLCIWIGVEFYLFMKWGQSVGAESFHQRPPGVEGFLPISALISFKYWIQTGIINEIHPSGLFILFAILGVSILLKKAFCSWLCPVGTLSESLWMLGAKLFDKKFRVPCWLDYPLRSLKYLLMIFFVVSISTMDIAMVKDFIYSPYNKVADIKMYLFFANISSFALSTIVILALLSVFIKNFWCRYLCPYGALLGFFSFLSPLKTTRNAATCIDCELCTKACPSSIKVHTAGRVWSDECTSCYSCVVACPVKNTLVMSTSKKRRAVPSWVFGLLLVGVFTAITGLGILTHNWHNRISKDEYAKRFQNIGSPLYQHNRGQVPHYNSHD